MICPECKSENSKENMFCINCGSKISANNKGKKKIIIAISICAAICICIVSIVLVRNAVINTQIVNEKQIANRLLRDDIEKNYTIYLDYIKSAIPDISNEVVLLYQGLIACEEKRATEDLEKETIQSAKSKYYEALLLLSIKNVQKRRR
jgi:hypothetical protein